MWSIGYQYQTKNFSFRNWILTRFSVCSDLGLVTQNKCIEEMHPSDMTPRKSVAHQSAFIHRDEVYRDKRFRKHWIVRILFFQKHRKSGMTWKKLLFFGLINRDEFFWAKRFKKTLDSQNFIFSKTWEINVDTFKKPFSRFPQSRWVILGETVQKILDCQNFILSKTLEITIDTFKKSFFYIFINRAEVHWAKRFKK